MLIKDFPIRDRSEKPLLQEGFTLVELAIVLVIIGLVVGGVIAGSALITAAQNRAIFKEVDEFETATLIFKDKYQGLPGDFSRASTYFSPAECPNFGPHLCNGDGNGIIDNFSPSGTETYRSWQHLQLAGLIGGKNPYAGYLTSTVPGVDTPASKHIRAAYQIFDTAIGYAAWCGYFVGGSHIYFLGAEGNTTSFFGPLFTPNEAQVIDTKYDDGLPWTGKVHASQGAWYPCHNFSIYNNSDTIGCVLGIKTRF